MCNYENILRGAFATNLVLLNPVFKKVRTHTQHAHKISDTDVIDDNQ